MSGRKPASRVTTSSLTERSLVKKRSPLARKASRRSEAASEMPPAASAASLSSARRRAAGAGPPRGGSARPPPPPRSAGRGGARRGRARRGGASAGEQPLERRAPALARLREGEQVGRQRLDPRVDRQLLGLQRDAAHDVAAPRDGRAAVALDLVVAVAEAHDDAAHALG